MAAGTQDHSETPPPPRLLDQVRDQIRFRHYSIRTEHAYVDWIKRFIRFYGKRQRGATSAKIDQGRPQDRFGIIRRVRDRSGRQ
jgi:Phage integrase, N-terminal SAM-like domain